MAREASITQEQVNAAADKIRATGAKPAARTVRDVLGTGSMATVLKFLQVWQAGQVQPATHDVTLPPALTRGLVDFIGQEVAQAKAGLEADLATAQQAAADLIAESERQAATIEAQEADIEEAGRHRAELIGKLGQVEADMAAARAETGRERLAAEAARTELAKAQLRLEAVPRIESDVDRLRGELEAERLARTEADRLAAVSTAKLEALQAANGELVRQIDTLKVEHAKQIQAGEGRAEKAEARASKAEQNAQVLASELATASIAAQTCQVRLESAENELTVTAAKKSAGKSRGGNKIID